MGGTGKTERLTTEAKALIDSLGAHGVMYVTFSRRARYEATKRMKDFGYEQSNLPYFRTFHSNASRLLELNKNNFVTRNHKKTFCDGYTTTKIDYILEEDEEPDEDGLVIPTTLGEEKALGNWLFNFYNFLKNSKTEFKNAIIPYEINEKWHVEVEELVDFFGEWERYKKNNALYEYVDCISECIAQELKPTDLSAIIVDEFQDISPLIYDLYKLWSEGIENVIVAGDPYQCIYRYAGADKSYLEGEKVDEVIELTTNYRLCEEVKEYGEKILGKDINCECVRRGANILSVNSMEDALFLGLEYAKEGNVFFQFRIKFYMKTFARFLNENLVPYTVWGGITPWTRTFCLIHYALYKLKRNEKLEGDVTRAFIKRIPSKGNLVRGIKKRLETDGRTEYMTDEIWAMFPKRLGLDEILNIATGLVERQKTMMYELLLRDIPPIPFNKINIHLTTMHSAKGGESSSSTFVSNNISKRIMDNMIEDSNAENDERNIFYTAVTRTRKDLVIMDRVFGDITYELPQTKTS